MLVHWIWFSLLQGMNGRQKLQLLEHFHSPEDIYQLDRTIVKRVDFLGENALAGILNKDLTAANRIIRDCANQQIGVLAFTDTGFPERLRRIDDPPMVLYYRGALPAWDMQPVIGVVGTRKASSYGLRIAGQISAQIAACGGIVASGGALGIDTCALEGAGSQGQKTVAVLAGGLDNFYPKSNEPLFRRIIENGCLLSEYPPQTTAYKWNFLRRNRLISGISNGVLVVEAPAISGALNTARWAWSQGREVFAVPGNIDVESCAGSNNLIGDIAHAAVNGWSVMCHYEMDYPHVVKKAEPRLQQEESPWLMVAQQQEKPVPESKADKINVDNPKDCPYSVKEKELPPLTEQEKAVVALLGATPIAMEQLVAQLEMSSGAVMSIITRLAVKGVVKNHPGKLISLN